MLLANALFILVSCKINIQSFLISPHYDLACYLTADSILLTTFLIISAEIKWMIRLFEKTQDVSALGTALI